MNIKYLLIQIRIISQNLNLNPNDWIEVILLFSILLSSTSFGGFCPCFGYRHPFRESRFRNPLLSPNAFER